MKPETIKSALDIWQPWQDSVDQARMKFDFRPDFSLEDYNEWVSKVGWKPVIKEALESLRKFSLPWLFAEYWLNCFWGECEALSWSSENTSPWSADYTEVVTQGIVKPYYSRTTLTYSKGMSKKVSFPWPFVISVNFPYAVRKGDKTLSDYFWGKQKYQWHGKQRERVGLFRKEQDGRWTYILRQFVAPQGYKLEVYFPDEKSSQTVMPLSVSLEMPLFLATDDVLKIAFQQVRYFRNGFHQLIGHPLIEKAKTVGFAKGGDIRKRQSVIAEEILALSGGKRSFTELLQSEFVRDKDIRETLKKYENTYGKQDPRYKDKARREAHTVYVRVRKWLEKRGIPREKPERGWWWKCLGI